MSVSAVSRFSESFTYSSMTRFDASIESGAYPIWAYEHMYTKGEPTGATKAFLDYVLSPGFQASVLPNVKGFISVTGMKVTKDKD